MQKIAVKNLRRITLIAKKGDVGPEPSDARLLDLIIPRIPKVYDGKPGKDGHTPTAEEILAIIRPHIPKAKDGETPSDARLLSLITPLIPTVKDGRDGRAGTDGKDGSPDTGDEIILKINKSKLKIDGKRVRGIGEPFGGNRVGASTTTSRLADAINEIKFGTGLTATINAFGVVTVSATASGFSKLTPTGTIDGSNTSFTFTSAPAIIVVDGIPKQATQSDGTVNWTGTTTVTLSVAPNFDIFGY